jgi:hypothetical protein
MVLKGQVPTPKRKRKATPLHHSALTNRDARVWQVRRQDVFGRGVYGLVLECLEDVASGPINEFVNNVAQSATSPAAAVHSRGVTTLRCDAQSRHVAPWTAC